MQTKYVLEDESLMRNHTISMPFTVLGILFCLCFIIDGFLELKVIEAFGVKFTAGMLIIAITYVLNDCIVEVYGFARARLLIWTTFAVHLMSVGLLQLACFLPSPDYWDGAEHFNFIFGLAPRITAASIIAFIIGSTTNAYIMSSMKARYGGKFFKYRAMLSTIAGESLDAATFFTLGFAGIIPAPELLTMIAVQASCKCLIEASILPITCRVVRYVKALDGTDTYDNGIRYSLFSLKVS